MPHYFFADAITADYRQEDGSGRAAAIPHAWHTAAWPASAAHIEKQHISTMLDDSFHARFTSHSSALGHHDSRELTVQQCNIRRTTCRSKYTVISFLLDNVPARHAFQPLVRRHFDGADGVVSILGASR